MRSFILTLLLTVALPALSADKTFQVNWSPDGATAGATGVTVRWLVNGGQVGGLASVVMSATSRDQVIAVNDGDTVTAEIKMHNSNGENVQQGSVTAVVGLPPQFSVTGVQQLD